MSLAVFAIGVIVFAVTVYGTVMAGGLVLTRKQLDEDPLRRSGLTIDPDTGLPEHGQY